MTAFLLAENGPRAGQRYDLKAPQSVMGRHPDCQIVIDVGAVSRQHAQVVAEGADFFIEDLKSRNGTFLNDKQIAQRSKLKDGDRLRVCDVQFVFRQEQPLAEAPPTPAKPNPLTATVGAGVGLGTVLIDDSKDDSGSTIMSKLDVSTSSGRLQLAASPEAKLAALIEITKSLGKALALDEVLPGVLNSLFKIFVQADRGFIVMRTADGRLVPMWTKLRREGDDDTIRISRTIVGQVMGAKEAILSADAATDTRFEMSQSIADFRIRSMMCAPLLDTEGNSLGVLQIDTLDQRKRFQAEDLEVLASVAAQAGIAIHNAQMHEEALRQRAVQRDLEVAREVQRAFLPTRHPDLSGYQFYDYYEPANHVGGDFYDFLELPDGRLAVMVADVVGHGVAAALLVAKLSAEVRFSLVADPNPATAVNRINDVMSRLQLDRFVTMILTVLDPATHEITIVNAGHMAPIHRYPDGRIDEPGEDIAGMPLGITDGMEYEACKITLGPGELLTLYTDGVNECMSAAGEMYGIDRIRGVSKNLQTPSAQLMGQGVIDSVRKFLKEENGTQEDDMCLVCYGRT